MTEEIQSNYQPRITQEYESFIKNEDEVIVRKGLLDEVTHRFKDRDEEEVLAGFFRKLLSAETWNDLEPFLDNEGFRNVLQSLVDKDILQPKHSEHASSISVVSDGVLTRDLEKKIEEHENIDQKESDADVLLYIKESFDEDELREVNQKSIEKDTPLFYLFLSGNQLILSTVIPGVTPCFDCFRLRFENNITNYKDYQRTRKKESEPNNYDQTAVRFATSLLMRHLQNFYESGFSATCKYLIVANIDETTLRKKQVLKLPRCPSCGKLSDGIPDQQVFSTLSTFSYDEA
jgi:thiazole/oxazole-forming peptide maturase SagC family component